MEGKLSYGGIMRREEEENRHFDADILRAYD